MLILTIRTDKPEAEIGLYEGQERLAYDSWLAHRELAETIHEHIRSLLQKQNRELGDLAGIAVFKGPGSFTGLRIGVSVANALAYALHVPVAASGGDDWIASALERLRRGEDDETALPEYGSPPHITPPKK